MQYPSPEIEAHVDPLKLSQVIIGSLEGTLMISRLQGNEGALASAREHLDEYLERNVRAIRGRSKRKKRRDRVALTSLGGGR